MAEEDTEEGTEGGKKKSPMLLIIIAVVVLLAGGGGAFFMMGGDDEQAVAENGEAAEGGEGAEADAKSAYYFSLDPTFVVNFTGKSRARFLQVNIEGMTRDEKVKEAITKHIPQVRNNIILLLSSKTHKQLNTPDGKETLRKEVLKEIQDILLTETGKEGVEDVYFTSFVMQ